MTVYSYVYLIVGFLGLAVSLVPYFIAEFPNGYTPTVAYAFAVIIGVIDYNSKLRQSI